MILGWYSVWLTNYCHMNLIDKNQQLKCQATISFCIKFKVRIATLIILPGLNHVFLVKVKATFDCNYLPSFLMFKKKNK